MVTETKFFCSITSKSAKFQQFWDILYTLNLYITLDTQNTKCPQVKIPQIKKLSTLGVRLYHQRHYQQAISRWRSALHRLRSADDKFVTIGYLAQAFCDAGDYENMARTLYYMKNFKLLALLFIATNGTG